MSDEEEKMKKLMEDKYPGFTMDQLKIMSEAIKKSIRTLIISFKTPTLVDIYLDMEEMLMSASMSDSIVQKPAKELFAFYKAVRNLAVEELNIRAKKDQDQDCHEADCPVHGNKDPIPADAPEGEKINQQIDLSSVVKNIDKKLN